MYTYRTIHLTIYVYLHMYMCTSPCSSDCHRRSRLFGPPAITGRLASRSLIRCASDPKSENVDLAARHMHMYTGGHECTTLAEATKATF